MVKKDNSIGFTNISGSPSTLKITRKGKKFVAVSMVLSSLLLGSLTSYATSQTLGVYSPTIVYAETLSELQAKYAELNEQFNSKAAEVNKYAQEMESHSGDWWKGWFSPWGTAKVNKEKAEGELSKILEQKNELAGKIAKDPTQKKINDIDSSVSAAYHYVGKEAGDKEKAKAEQQKALVRTEQELKEGSAKSQADENSKKSNKGKTESVYKGGTDQNINTKDNDRQYVKDPRRSSTDAIKFISDDEATKSLMESSTRTINSSVGDKNLLVYSKDGMLSFSSSIYRSLSKDDQRKTMSFALKTIKESQLPSKVKTKVTNFIADQDRTVADSIQALNSDTSSELSSGYAWFIPFASPFSTVLGVLAIVIFVFLTVSLVVDVAYLTVGIFRQFLENGEGRPKFVSGEAWETAREVDMSLQSGTYKDYLVVYFRKRMSILILTSLVLAYLISGQIYGIFTTLLDVIRELFNIRG
jgi:hypothetical protein